MASVATSVNSLSTSMSDKVDTAGATTIAQTEAATAVANGKPGFDDAGWTDLWWN